MAAALPAPTAARITDEIRLAYVLHHFRRAYEQTPRVSIGYASLQPQVEIADCGASFFAQQLPYPAGPTRLEWRGQLIPVFFDSQPAKPLLELLPTGRALVNADLIAGAFYLLSGWQEYFSDERDRYGRFPYAASVQHRYDFVTMPLVNYYFDILRTAVAHVTGQPLLPRRWANGAPFATFVTHDIDNLRSAWKAPAKAAFRRRDWLQFGRQVGRHFSRPDAWDNLELVQQTVADLGAKSTFFFLPEHRPAPDGTPNADYRIRTAWQDIKRLAANGAEIGLHGSLLGTDSRRLHTEAELVVDGPAGLGLRFHYLRWEPRTTPSLVAQTGFAYDTTLGFAEHFGFRNSYCLPFQPFNFARGEAYSFLEIPLNVMDVTLHHPNYLRLAPHEILPALTSMFREIERFGGVCTLLWHNDHFDPTNETTGPHQFADLMQYLRGRNTTFVNGKEILEELGVES